MPEPKQEVHIHLQFGWVVREQGQEPCCYHQWVDRRMLKPMVLIIWKDSQYSIAQTK